MDLITTGNRSISGILSKTTGAVLPQAGGAKPADAADQASFASLLSSAMGETVAADAEDKLGGLGLLVGEAQDLHSLTIEAEKAEITLALTMQMRNKMIEAYQEVMRMQI